MDICYGNCLWEGYTFRDVECELLRVYEDVDEIGSRNKLLKFRFSVRVVDVEWVVNY